MPVRKESLAAAAAGAVALALAAAAVLAAGPRRPSPPTPRILEENVELGGLKVTVWSEASPAAGRQPVLLFSHGFHGCSTQSEFLMDALAADGYLVFAPNHSDATCNGGQARWTDPPEEPFADPQAWSDATFAGRRQDMQTLAAAIASDPSFGPRADFSRLAVAGHSLGGYTVLGLGGAWPSWNLPGVRAVLALSPYDQPFLVHETLGGLAAPVMYQGGTLDLGITPSIEKPDGGYDASPRPKYFAELFGAGHLAWTNLGPLAPRADIVADGVAFLDRYVNGAPAAPVLTQPQPGVFLLRYDSELGDNGNGQRGGRR
ncbi:MAG TPA: hypothetical protein VKE50_09145 [Thermoanaerobaculia bacterium]|nr:hypothetical protein [Thermoanaerobaculia bacterium]